MLTRVFDVVMERRARRLMEDVQAWLPAHGPVLDLGSGTGHLSARLEQELGLEVVPDHRGGGGGHGLSPGRGGGWRGPEARP